MRRSLKIALFFSVAVMCSVGGYVLGYFQGYVGGLGHLALSNAVGTVSTLEAIRENKKQNPIVLLEMRLDTEIIMNANYEANHFQLTKLLDGSDGKVLVKRVADYREKYPSLIPDPEVQARIKQGLRIKNE